MSRKAFFIWGLVIINLGVASVAIAQFLILSAIIDIKTVGAPIALGQFLLPIAAFGILLYFRFKEIGYRKRILAICVFFYFASLPFAGVLSGPYLAFLIEHSDAWNRFHDAIGDWARSDEPKSATPWNLGHKLDFILLMLPSNYFANWGLFALLWFGSLDPRKPSKIRIFQFFKTGFRKANATKSFERPKMVSAA